MSGRPVGTVGANESAPTRRLILIPLEICRLDMVPGGLTAGKGRVECLPVEEYRGHR
ncbi:hypothetical protein THIOKS1700019 [Thiocapsa sp. KS1]|nr:hypothetical protein THIOKS1700019 [Thiocapsa sp. KS1]